ncbi:MAG: 23S rRNA (guanosine(2251)-2'-O)-methyltransferase RlmB [Myxococcota bacterium]
MSRLYGQNAVEDLLQTHPAAIARVLIARGASSLDAFASRVREQGIPVKEVAPAELKRRSGGRGAVSVGADLRYATPIDLQGLAALAPEAPFILALDGVTDPHNLGAIMRSAAAFGAAALITTERRSAPLNDAAVRASAGAVAHVPLLRVTNLPRALRELKKAGYWVVASLAEGGQPLWELDLTDAIILLVGAEGAGVRPGVAAVSDFTATLPLPGPVQSLNASVFAGIAASEAARQRAVRTE